MTQLTEAKTGDYIHLHFLVFLWGFTSILGVLIKDLNAIQVVLWRGLLTVGGLIFVISYQKNWELVPRKVVLQMLGVGAILALHWITFFAAARIANVSTCLAGLATCSFWTSILEPLITRRKFRLFELVLGVLVFAGLNLIIYADLSLITGLMIGVLSAICSALFSTINVHFVQRFKPITITFYELLGCTIAALVLVPMLDYIWPPASGIPTDILAFPAGESWIYLLLLAWLCTVYAYTASVSLMKKFTVFAMNLTINLEPVYGIILAWLIFGKSEEMTLGFYAGTALILVSVLVYPSLSKRFMG